MSSISIMQTWLRVNKWHYHLINQLDVIYQLHYSYINRSSRAMHPARTPGGNQQTRSIWRFTRCLWVFTRYSDFLPQFRAGLELIHFVFECGTNAKNRSYDGSCHAWNVCPSLAFPFTGQEVNAFLRGFVPLTTWALRVKWPNRVLSLSVPGSDTYCHYQCQIVTLIVTFWQEYYSIAIERLLLCITHRLLPWTYLCLICLPLSHQFQC